MNGLLILIPVALVLASVGLLAFLWSLKSGQFEDLQGAAYRILEDDGPLDVPEKKSGTTKKPLE